jgi:hypothetical protein
MTRAERLVLLAFFAVVLSVLGGWEQTATAIGGVAGAGAGVVVAGRSRRLTEKIDAKLGPDDSPAPTGFALQRPAARAGLQVVVLGGLFVTTVFVPFVGDELFAGTAAGATAFPLVLTAARLRR